MMMVDWIYSNLMTILWLAPYSLSFLANNKAQIRPNPRTSSLGTQEGQTCMITDSTGKTCRTILYIPGY